MVFPSTRVIIRFISGECVVAMIIPPGSLETLLRIDRYFLSSRVCFPERISEQRARSGTFGNGGRYQSHDGREVDQEAAAGEGNRGGLASS